MENKNQNRRKFLTKLGVAVSAGAGLGLLPNTALANSELPSAQTWAMWIHGSAGRIEGSAHDGQKSPITMIRLKKMMPFSSLTYFRSSNNGGMPGTTVALEGEAAGTMIQRLVVANLLFGIEELKIMIKTETFGCIMLFPPL